MLLDEDLIAYRVHGELTVARDVCPHRGVPLSLGTLEPEGIVCAYHGFRYGLQGRCNRIPADPRSTYSGHIPLENLSGCGALRAHLGVPCGNR